MSVGIVIPVRNLERDFENIEVNLRLCLEHKVYVWVIFDSETDCRSQKWDYLRSHFSNNLFSFVRGNFNSPGLARNAALSKLNVEWIGFCDGDDSINVDALSWLAQYGTANQLDLVVANLEARDKDGLNNNKTHGVFSGLPIPVSLSIFPAFTRIVYRVNFIREIYFPEYKLGEDQCFLFEILCKAPKSGYIDTTIYLYNRNVQGQLTSKRENCLELLKSVHRIEQLNREYHFKYNLIASIMKMRLMITYFKMSQIHSKSFFAEILYFFADFTSHPIRNTRAAFYIVKFRRKLN